MTRALLGPTHPGHTFEVHEVDFAYQRRRHTGRETLLIENFSARFEASSFTALTGISGRGKSTLLYILGLMLTPLRGSVSYAGLDLSPWSDAARSRFRARTMGFVFQDAALDPHRTVFDNITETATYCGQPRALLRGRATALAAHFGVEARLDHRPGQISGGQAQRVALCRAFVSRPPLILADEPTGNLDNESSAVVVQALGDYARGGGIVICASHDDRLISHATNVVSL
ncbi:ATP-binding cassette domain-containing protein [Micrococcales bacterium 31B]|nr:ATP-binding cassette domain-containing protein [Micrococcales bacterium 31B]